MNRFRTRRRAKVENAENDAPSTPYLSGKTFRRNKKNVVQKPEVDLTKALPSTDDFRTSLLMPKMSARFSMLREQDDPSSKIGKASDDSVIFNRASRLADLLDLPDDGSVRPPFARDRLGSYGSGDGYGTDDDSMSGGSVMSRARPGEGNVLFGGRQKVYKIYADESASTKGLIGSRTRFLYDQDVHLAAFQSFREEDQRKSGNHEVEQDEKPHQNPNPLSRARSDSPHLYEYNPNRETVSSTESAPSNERSSTAATSVASQIVGGTPGGSIHALSAASTPKNSSPVLPNAPASTASKLSRVTAKSRRLYEQGLDQHMHEQQSSALSRLDQLARQRAAGAGSPPPSVPSPPLSQAPSVSGLRERYDRNGPSKPNPPPFRSMSPSPPIASPDLASFNFGLGDNKSLTASRLNVIQSPPLSPISNEFDAAIRPEDRGKATATGAFARPTSPYDEQQYSQRQLQMQLDRSNPGSRKGSLADREVPLESDTTHGGSLENSLLRDPVSEASIGQTEQDTGGVTDNRGAQEQRSGALGEAPLPSDGTFLAPLSASVSSLGAESVRGNGRLLDFDPGSRHASLDPENEVQGTQSVYRQGVTEGVIPPQSNLGSMSTDPAMTSQPMADLSGLVRQHLRTDSGQSSIHLAATPVSPRPAFNTALLPNGLALPGLVPSTRSSAADPDYRNINQGPPADLNVSSAHLMVGNNVSQVPDFKVQHTRNASSETQKAREEFANELAHRRRMVQENLKSFVESEGRPASPTREKSKTSRKGISPLRSTSALGILKPKSTPNPSQTPLAAMKPDASTKAMRMLGISGSEVTKESSQDMKRSGSDQMKQEEDKMLQSIARGSNGPQMRNWGQIRRDARREFERRQREDKGASRQAASMKTPSPPSSSGSARDGSGSDTSAGHPRVRDGIARDESPITLLKTPGTFGIGHDLARRGPHQPYARISPRGPSPSSNQASPSEWPRFNGSTSGQAPTQRKVVLPNRSEVVAPLDAPPRPSPIAPYSANSTPSLNTSPVTSSRNSPTQEVVPWSGTVPLHCKKVIQKSDISEPTLVASTSDINTVDLPSGASLSNGADECTPPPVPALNPRRKTRVVINGFLRGSNTIEPAMSVKMHIPSSGEEKSTFSDDDSPPPKPRLWKPSSEGGSLNARNRHQAAMAPSPRTPNFPLDVQRSAPAVTAAEGGMF